MPSDDRTLAALEALRRPIGEFRSMLEGALARAEYHLHVLESDAPAQAARMRRELGQFAESRVDLQAFSALFGRAEAPIVSHQERFRTAVETLRDVLERGDGLFVVQVPSGSSLGRAVEEALARIGRAFGAVLAIELIRGSAFRPEEHEGLLQSLAFRSWTRNERRFAPPLIVEVEGADLHVGALSDFTDGRERLVLVVRGACPPAPLARLITPGTMVLQTHDGAALAQLALYDGPGIAAVVPPEAAAFLHDPRAGREPWQRLSIWHMPTPPKQAMGGVSSWQMGEDLRQLAALASAPAEAPLPATVTKVSGGREAVDRLADWLLVQSGFRPSG